MFKKKIYKIRLSKEQMNTIYSLTYNEEKQSRLMSILQYCIKYTDKTTGILTKTIGRLFTMYSAKDFKYHDRISRKYFYTLIDLLIDHKLVCVHKIVHKTVHKNNVDESVEITNVKADFGKLNNKSITNTNTYTLNTTDVIKSGVEKVHALDIVNDVFKSFKVKSREVKSMVIAKLQNIILDAAGAVNYIVKVLAEKTEQYNNMRIKYAQKVAETKYAKSNNTYSVPVTRTFNNFEYSSFYDDIEYMKSLENTLLGWDK